MWHPKKGHHLLGPWGNGGGCRISLIIQVKGMELNRLEEKLRESQDSTITMGEKGNAKRGNRETCEK